MNMNIRNATLFICFLEGLTIVTGIYIYRPLRMGEQVLFTEPRLMEARGRFGMRMKEKT